MKASELVQMLRQLAGQLQSGDPGFDPVRAIETMRMSADRLEKATKLGTISDAHDHAKMHGKPNPLDFAFGAEWHAEQIEKGTIDR